ncbi:MAG: hypothetical protein ACKVS9_05280 [Phycisphaerae bacterium]
MTKRVSRSFGPITAALAVIALTPTASAQWVTQSFELVSGMNAIYVEIEPATSGTADDVFVTTPPSVIQSVWTWLPPGVSATADNPSYGDTQWRVWLPPGDPANVANSVFRVYGGQVHLIQTTAAATLTIVGRPYRDRSRWQVGQNVNGFHVEPGGGMTFGDYLGPSTAFDSDANTAGQQLEVFEMNAAGVFTAVASPTTTPIVAGRAYWVSCNSPVEYDGPFEIDSRTIQGIAYARNQGEHRVELRNLAPIARSLSFAVSQSVAPPTGMPTLPADSLGAIPLQYRDYSSATSVFSRVPLALDTPLLIPFPAAPTNGSLNPTKALWLSCVRAGRAPALIDPLTGLGEQYQSVLTVRDGTGYRRWLPVTAEVGSRAGLYIGSVTLSKVQWVQADARILDSQPPLDDFATPDGVDDNVGDNPAADNDPVRMRPTAQSFSFPVMVHRDEAGACKFLSSVSLRYIPAAGETPGRYVLATPSCENCGTLLPGGIAGAIAFPVRFSTAAFSFADDLPMVGDFDTQLTLAAPLEIAADDPLNPFRHKFHPHHNTALGGTVISFTRSPIFRFDVCADLIGAAPADAGNEVLRGCYEETFTGLHKRSITVGGTFELRRVSDISVLNDGN